MDDNKKMALKAIEEYKKLLEEGKQRYEFSLSFYELAHASWLETSKTGAIEDKRLLEVRKKIKDEAEKEVQKNAKYLEGLKESINSSTKQLEIAAEDKSLKYNKDKEQKKKQKAIKETKKKVTRNTVKSSKIKKPIIATSRAASVYVVSVIFDRQLKKLSKSIQHLTELVDKTNNIIEAVETKQDVLRAKIARDSALVTLNKAEGQLAELAKILKVLQIILIISRIMLFILLLVPLKTSPQSVKSIVKIMSTIDALTIFVTIASAVVKSLIDEIQYQKTRLLAISDIVDRAINDNLSPLEISELLNRKGNYGKLGILDGVIYRGFTFAIYEENDPKFVVAGNKRRYAVAMDRSGFIVLYSQPSFTLDPEILIEELKLKINNNNLEP